MWDLSLCYYNRLILCLSQARLYYVTFPNLLEWNDFNPIASQFWDSIPLKDFLLLNANTEYYTHLQIYSKQLFWDTYVIIARSYTKVHGLETINLKSKPT